MQPALSLGLHLDDRAGPRRHRCHVGLLRQRVRGTRAMMGLLPVGRRPAHPVLEPAGRGAGARAAARSRPGRRAPDARSGRKPAHIVDRRGRGRRFLARDLPPRRPAALERRPDPVHRRCRARHQPAARPGRQSRPGRCLDLGRCARRNRRHPVRARPLRRAPRRDRALLSPGQPSADAVLPVGRRRRSAGCATRSWGWRAGCRVRGRSWRPTLAGMRRGWLSSARLDAEGRYRLDG